MEKNFQNFIQDLEEMIKIHSYLQEDNTKYPFGEPIQKALETMIAICDRLSFRTFIDPEGYYGYAETGEGEKMLGVLGHLDVVPPGDLQKWNTPPFEPTIIDDKIYGRGTQDDKGPILTAIYAIKNLLDNGFKLNYRVRFIFGTDEENLWRCIPKYIEKEEIPSVGFSPDSRFPLIYAEKGLLQCKLRAKNDSGLIFVGGDAFNSVPSKMVVNKTSELIKALTDLNYEFIEKDEKVEIIGKSVHAQVAETGINAINRYMEALEKSGVHTKSGKFIIDNIVNHPFAEPIFGSLEDEHSGKLKFNIGKIEFTPEEEILGIDIRIPVTVKTEDIVEKLSEVAKKYGFTYEKYDYLRPLYTPLDSPLIKTLMSAYVEATGDTESQPVAIGGATYARAIDNCVAFGFILPGKPKTEHQPNEYIYLNDAKTAMKIYENAFIKFNEEK
ncbi:Sapep family Mn(2+)-dependent dipeptidase [Fusobacterium sp.]|uniref:Sapep family Mn(2+)-dependent dipeptidase n=1 Tax=Fusobacterium sp. TaxID=68766 RepID=UPI00262CBEF2|nr:Sapep family Mn(2+)-dependent dipeptidase [Fusobacterium sp.]